MAAHRMRTVGAADWILVLDQGTLMDSGCHDEVTSDATHPALTERHPLLELTRGDGRYYNEAKEADIQVATPKRQPMFNELRSIRVGRNFSRQALADLVGVNVQTIGALERGHYSPSMYLALRLAMALNVGVEELFWLEKSDADESLRLS